MIQPGLRMYEAVFYTTPRGEEPVREFIEGLSEKTQQKTSAWISLLETHGPELRRPYADKVAGRLYELRVRLGSDQIRILYCFTAGSRIVLLHAFRKKSAAIAVRDLETAQNRMTDYFARFG